ncbi:MAG TPA: hypothetical protein VE621_24730, partial [Bryobacteraceae bacterium]|nr:hypothetical protein [Bryobacteraceae bacterium]
MSPTALRHELEGKRLDDRLLVHRFVTGGEDDLFEGEFQDGSRAMVRVRPEQPEFGAMLERYLEASFLDHPNLLRCVATGRFTHEGESYVYAAFPAPESLLSDLTNVQPMPPNEVKELALQLIDGLDELHSRNLVLCDLNPFAIARIGSRWAICDYWQMRVAGDDYRSETRKLLARNPQAPPEAYNGVVTRAWDTWELANLCRHALLGPAPRRIPDEPLVRTNKEVVEPFRILLSRCLVPNYRERCDLQDVRSILETPVQEPAPAVGQPAVAQPAVAPPVAVASESPAPAQAPWPAARARTYATPDKEARDWRPAVAAVLIGALIGLAILAFIVKRPSQDEDVVPTASNAPPVFQAPQAADPASNDGSRSRESAPKPDVRDILDRWATAARTGDMAAQSTFYAPVVERYFKARNVSRDWIRRDKERDAESSGPLTELQLGNVSVREVNPNTALVSFNKTWANAKGASGKVRSEIRMEKSDDGNWQITSER